MKSLEIKAIRRTEFGKKANKKLRNDDNIPCVLYGGKDVVHFYVHELALKELIYSPNVYVVNLVVENEQYNALLQDIQYHPVNDKIFHVDFYEVYADKKVTIGVPVVLSGHSIGVREGGRLILEHRKLKVRGLFQNLPDQIAINVESLELGKSIRVGDLPTEKFKFTEPASNIVVSVKLTRVVKDAETEEGVAAPAEGEVAEGENKTEQAK